MLLASASIGRKLLLSFASMASLLILAVVIGASGFSFVAETEKQVIDSSVPAMIQAREVSEQSSKILSSLGVLSNAQTERERQQAGALLFSQLEKLLDKIKLLGDKPFDVAILERLESKVQNVIDTIVELGVVVEEKLLLDHVIILQVEEMRQLAVELETLTRTQVLNTSTIAVANITNIYNLIEKQDNETVYRALDNLIEVDLDLSERLHELHLLAFQMLAHIEEARAVTDSSRIQKLRAEFEHNIDIIKRRILSVEDPTRSRQMEVLVGKLEQRKEVFDNLDLRYENRQNAENLMVLNLKQLSELNKTVSLLVDESNSDTALAIKELGETLTYAKWSLIVLSLLGLVAVSFILWNVVYLSVVKKLHIYSDAIRSVANGDLAFDIDVKGSDELAQMGKAIVIARDTAEQLQIVAASDAVTKNELEDHKAHLEETITERTKQLRMANEKLNQEVLKHNQARIEAEQANRAKTAFLSTMSHEIRTPMNGVLGTATLLDETRLNNKQKQYVDVINRSGNTLLGILNDVLDYSKIEAGFLEIREAPFNLLALVTDVYQLQKSKATEKQLGFSMNVDKEVSGYWLGDATRITQVLNNLVSNAIKFTSTGDVSVNVSKDSRHSGRILFRVIDAGVGISEYDKSKLFDAFTQVGNAKAKLGGTGLGLAISQKIVTAMGGLLEVGSELNQGSVFGFSIPLEVSLEIIKPKTVVKEQTNLVAKILLVEDNPVNCLVAEGFLTNNGHDVVIAENGAQARALFKKQYFDIGLLDINLPDCNGVELLADLRLIEADSHSNVDKRIPMVAISAHVFNEEVQGYLKAGFDGYLPKPLDKSKLLILVQSILKGRTLQRPQPPFEAEAHQELVDLHVLDEDCKVLGVEKVLELIKLFERSSLEIIRQIDQAVIELDPALVKQLAHKLKGSAGSMGMNTLHASCLEVESNDDPIETYQQQRDSLILIVERSIKMVKEARE